MIIDPADYPLAIDATGDARHVSEDALEVHVNGARFEELRVWGVASDDAEFVKKTIKEIWADCYRLGQGLIVRRWPELETNRDFVVHGPRFKSTFRAAPRVSWGCAPNVVFIVPEGFSMVWLKP